MSKKDRALNIGKEEIEILGQVVDDNRFNFSAEDLAAVKGTEGGAAPSSKPFGRAQVVLKKVRAMRKAAMKAHFKQQRDQKAAAKAPISREEVAKSFVGMKEGQELGASIAVFLDILVKNKLTTMKEFDRLWQEKVLDGRHPDPCPQCKGYEPKPKKGADHCIIDPEHRTTVLAKEAFPDLKGAKAKRVIQCQSYEYDANPNPDFPEENEDEKSNDNKEGANDNGGTA